VTNSEPANGASDIGTLPTFTWTGGDDPDSDGVTYSVFYGTSSSALTEEVDAGTNKTVQATVALQGNERYYWKVTAYSATFPQDSISSSTWNFTTFNNPPIVSLSSPADNTTKVPLSTTLSYSYSDSNGDNVTYTIYLGTNATLTDSDILATNITPTTYDISSLINATRYYWKVKATETAGFPAKSGESAVRSFYTINKLDWVGQLSYTCYRNEIKRIALLPLLDYINGHTINFSIINPNTEQIVNDTLIWHREWNNTTSKAISVIAEDTWSQDPKKDTANFVISVRTDGPAGMRFIPAANDTFIMGDDVSTYADAKPEHDVVLTANFWMDSTEVTIGEYKSTIASHYPLYRLPDWISTGMGHADDTVAYGISWYNAVLYCNALSLSQGKDTVYSYTGYVDTIGKDSCRLLGFQSDFSKNGYRLPTEAQREFACRAGTTWQWFWGSSSTGMGNYAWYGSNSAGVFHGTAKKMPNGFGLYDIVGNVSEHCDDWYESDYYTSSPVLNPMGPTSSSVMSKVLRGGHVNSFTSTDLTSYARRFDIPNSDVDWTFQFYGIRAVLPVE
jgi:formylglycine-generating enzyme required for sulfatase activity